jgi:hypothetical protein
VPHPTTRNQAPSPGRIDTADLVRTAVNRVFAGGPPSAVAVNPAGAMAD